MPQSAIPEEKYPAKVSAEFTQAGLAQETIKSLTEDLGFKREQITVIEPGDPNLSHKLEPETRAIGAGVAIRHVYWVVAGLLVGLAGAWLLVHMGPPLTQSSPLMTYLALLLICAMIGFALATILSMQPDHDHLVNKTRSAAQSGHWTVVVHCADDDEKSRAKHAMDYSAQTL